MSETGWLIVMLWIAGIPVVIILDYRLWGKKAIRTALADGNRAKARSRVFDSIFVGAFWPFLGTFFVIFLPFALFGGFWMEKIEPSIDRLGKRVGAKFDPIIDWLSREND